LLLHARKELKIGVTIEMLNFAA